MNTNQDRKWIFISLGSVGIFALLIIAILLFNSHPGTAADETNTNFVLKPEMQILQELNKAYVELAKISIPSVVKIKSEVTPKKSNTDLRQRKGDNSPFDPFNFFDDPFNT